VQLIRPILTDDWGLRPGRYAYDGKDVKLVELFDDDEVADLVDE
jgi:hypothetical protein